VREVRAVLFDFDGTLVDTYDLILASFRHATETVLGESLPDDVLMHNVGMPLRAQFELFGRGDAEEMTRVYREHNRGVHDEMIREYPHVRQVVADLASGGMPMAIVTSKGRPVLDRGMRVAGLDELILVSVSSDDVELFKPDPAPLAAGAERLGVELEHCVYLGDSPHDMAAANAGGAISVAALWGMFPKERVLAEEPDYALENMAELPLLLDGEADRFAVRPEDG
jgi:pyrophosphatase PpaX